MKQSLHRYLGISLVLVMPIVQSCSYIGPNSVKSDRRNYNDVLQKTNSEEILLNLVRMKYVDTPSFMSVNSITSQLSFSASTSLSSTKTTNGIADGVNTLAKTIAPSFTVTDNPVISYSPLQGDEYIRELLTPLNASILAFLGSSGAPKNVILKLSLTRINEVLNAPNASRPLPQTAPQFEQFDELLFSLDQLGQKVQIGYSVVDNKSLPTIRFEADALNTPVGKNISRILDLAPGINEFVLNSGDIKVEDAIINVKMRSMLGIFYFLSHSVRVPAEHEKLGWVAKTVNADGSAFDWNRMTKNYFNINVSSEKPSNSDIVVKYRGNWFSVARNDLPTKRTLTLLSQLLALQSGTVIKPPPTLTIPLN
jgi:hypothetical protein